ncbi:MAG: CRTAC1 family protein, partial [Bacteroidota bacterium]
MRAFIIMVLVLVLFSCSEKSSTDQVLSSDSVGREDIRLFDILSPAETGIIFKNELTESLAMNGLTYEYYYNGGGLAVADFNNDGMQDLYFISNLHQNKLYVNEGSLSFKDVSIESGTAQVSGYPTGVTTVDINADGWVDMYISCSGKFNDPDKRRNKLLVNQGLNDSGIPTFKEEGAKYGLDLAHFSTQAAFFDYDRDNDLDMVLINHFPDMYTLNNLEKLMDTESPYSGDKLFQNRNGKYVDVSKEAGFVNNRLSYALGIGISDLNNDGWPDIFVSNDYSGKDYLYMNNRDGSFSESVDRSLSHMSFASMGNNIADYNNDGWMDIFTLDMMAEDNYGIKTSLGEMHPERFQILTDAGLHYQYMYNTLQLNQGVHSDSQLPFFSDVAQIGGIMSTDWSWGPLVFDMDNDGYKDLFVGNGIKGDFVNNDFVEYIKIRQKEIMESGRMNTKEYVTSVLSRIPPRMRNNCFYRNLGDLTFEKKNRIWADDMPTCSNGSAYADLDNDGDMDIIVNNSDSESFIYRNNARDIQSGNFLQFQMEGPEKNPRGIGTKILLKQVDQIQVLDQYLSRGFQSSISSVLHFGLGKDTVVPEVEVIWPDGKKQVLKRVSSNQTIR